MKTFKTKLLNLAKKKWLHSPIQTYFYSNKSSFFLSCSACSLPGPLASVQTQNLIAHAFTNTHNSRRQNFVALGVGAEGRGVSQQKQSQSGCYWSSWLWQTNMMALCTCCWKGFSPMREKVSVMPKFSFKKWRKNQCLCCSVKYSKYAKEPPVLDFQINSKELLDSWKNPEFRVGSLTQWFFKPMVKGQNRFSDVWELQVKGIHIPYLPVPLSTGSKDRTSQHRKLEPITINNLKAKEKSVCQLHHSKWKISWLRQALTKEKDITCECMSMKGNAWKQETQLFWTL